MCKVFKFIFKLIRILAVAVGALFVELHVFFNI